MKAPILLAALVATTLTSTAEAQVRYRLDVNNTWSPETHPGAFPPGAHFSWLGGATHNEEATFWEEQQRASRGMVEMAETGATHVLMNEVTRKIRQETAGRRLSWQWWFCPAGTRSNACGSTSVVIVMREEFPLVTLVSMLGPSPDWFIGVSGLPLRENGRWLPRVVVDLPPYDGGTRSANKWALFGSSTVPPAPIALITEESGQLVGPRSLGTMTFTLISQPEFVRGDCNGDGNVDSLIPDAMFLLSYNFTGDNAEPPPCLAACDANGDGQVEGSVTDALHLLQHTFRNASSPVAPFPECGRASLPSDQTLGCRGPTAGCP